METIRIALVEKNVNFCDALKIFEDYPRKSETSEAQSKTHKTCWNDFSAFVQKKYNLEFVSSVDESHVIAYFNHLKKEGRFSPIIYKRGRKTIVNDKCLSQKLSPRSINNYIATLRFIFSILQKGKYIIENPLTNIELMEKDQEDRDIYSPEEIRMISDKTRGTYLFPIVIVGTCTGLRKGDICKLKWSSVIGSWLHIKKLEKTGNKVDIPIVPALGEYLATLERSGEYVFPELSRLYSSDDCKISTDFKKILNSCGIINRTKVEGRSRGVSTKDIYSLRHTFAYIAGKNRIPFPIVQSVLGHMSPKMTELYMRHANLEDKRNSIEQMSFPFELENVITIQVKDKRSQLKRILERITPSQFSRFRRVIICYA